MAGRGTDIKLAEGVKDVGGLFVLGSERHEARRIDNQLRGRSGRQGDPGASQFFVSMEDDLMRKFGADKIKRMMDFLKVPEDMPIENSLISGSIEGAQKKVEGYNFDIRKHLVEYDDVMNIHRNILYKRRREILEKDEVKDDILTMGNEMVEAVVRNHSEGRDAAEWNYKEIFENISAIHRDENNFKLEEIQEIKDQDELIEKCQNYLRTTYEARETQLPDAKMMRSIEKAIYLRATDKIWMDHIDQMSKLREKVAFSGYAQKDPLTEYKSQAYDAFNEMLALIRANTINALFKMDLVKVAPTELLTKSSTPKMQLNKSDSGESNSGSDNPVVIKVGAGNKVATKAGAAPELGRNDACHCGSGKKYKKCHGQQ